MTHDIPSTVLAAYQISSNAVYEQVSSGLINSTWLVQDGQRCLVLQKLNQIFSLSVNTTIDKVSKFLSDGPAHTTTLIRTINGTEYVLSEDDCWRCLSFLPGKTYSSIPNKKYAWIAGQALASFHCAMLSYPERHALPKITVHDLPLHRNNLVTALEYHQQHRDREKISTVAAEILSRIERIAPQPEFPLAVLHGDPKISNFIFDDKAQTACMIDLDTLGQGQVLSELGDAFRSWCNPAGEDTEDTYFDLDIFEQAMAGYLSIKQTPLATGQAQYIGVAIETICLELAARFCADALNEAYFGWDRQNFSSAAEHQLLRARGQLSLAKSVGAKQASISQAIEVISGTMAV